MSIGTVVKAVLTNKTVIFTAIVVFLYLDFVCFVAHYRKKNKPVAPKKSVAAPPPEPAADNADGGDASDEGADAAAEE